MRPSELRPLMGGSRQRYSMVASNGLGLDFSDQQMDRATFVGESPLRIHGLQQVIGTEPSRNTVHWGEIERLQ